MVAYWRAQRGGEARASGSGVALRLRLLKPARGGGVADEAAKKLAEIDATMAELQRARAELLRLVDLGCDLRREPPWEGLRSPDLRRGRLSHRRLGR